MVFNDVNKSFKLDHLFIPVYIPKNLSYNLNCNLKQTNLGHIHLQNFK